MFVYPDFDGFWWVRTDSELAGPYYSEAKARADFAPLQGPGLQLVDLPFSEVCIHMRICGQCMYVQPLPNGMAQILHADGRHFSFPVTWGEAGLAHLYHERRN